MAIDKRQPRAPLRIFGLARKGPRHFQSSAYIRLLAPLTAAAEHHPIEFTLLGPDEMERAAEGDVCIIQRTAIGNEKRAERLVRLARQAGCRLVMDIDDAVTMLQPDHPNYKDFSNRTVAFDLLLREADQAWFSTAPLLDLYRARTAHPSIVVNGLDPRLWCPERGRPIPFTGGGPARLLYMGTATHDADFALVLPALDRLDGIESFSLTVIGALREPPARPWLTLLTPPRDATAYPEFVAWLIAQGPFDIGIAPLADTVFNRGKSDIKFLDYTALGLASVLSDVPAYAGVAKSTRLAVFAANTEEGWFTALQRAITHRETSKVMAALAWDYLWGRRTVSAPGEQMVALLGAD